MSLGPPTALYADVSTIRDALAPVEGVGMVLVSLGPKVHKSTLGCLVAWCLLWASEMPGDEFFVMGEATVSLLRGPLYRPRNTTVLLVGTPRSYP